MAVTFSLLGKVYELAPLDSLTFDEAREFKRISGVPPGATATAALYDNDPDVWLGLLTVSIRRIDETFEVADLGDVALGYLVNALERDEPIPTTGANAPESLEEPATPASDPPASGGNGATSPSAENVTPDEAEALN